MANPLKGEAQLGEFTLTYNFGAFCKLEAKSGKKMPELLEALQTGLGFEDLRDYVWAGLQTHHAGISDETVAVLIDEQGGYMKVGPIIAKAVGNYFGTAPKEKAKNPPKAA